MPLYFPRNWKEEMEAKEYLPEDIGNENGEPVIAERKIRIIDKPTFAAFSKSFSQFHVLILFFSLQLCIFLNLNFTHVEGTSTFSFFFNQ